MTPWPRRFSRGDSVVFILALVMLAVSFSIFWQREGRGAEALILVNGQHWARLNLFQDQDYHVPGPLGDSHIRIQDGQVRFIDSPCPNKLCVHAGWISQGGDNNTCLPNRVSVQIPGNDSRFDTINF